MLGLTKGRTEARLGTGIAGHKKQVFFPLFFHRGSFGKFQMPHGLTNGVSLRIDGSAILALKN
jgi:hypothetical protein